MLIVSDHVGAPSRPRPGDPYFTTHGSKCFTTRERRIPPSFPLPGFHFGYLFLTHMSRGLLVRSRWLRGQWQQIRPPGRKIAQNRGQVLGEHTPGFGIRPISRAGVFNSCLGPPERSEYVGPRFFSVAFFTEENPPPKKEMVKGHYWGT